MNRKQRPAARRETATQSQHSVARVAESNRCNDERLYIHGTRCDRWLFAIVAALFLIFSSASLRATEPDAPLTTAIAVPTTGPLQLDGVLDEPDWQRATPVFLTQRDPHPGEPTPYVTTVRLLTDAHHVYLGIACTDPHPEQLAVHALQFDSDQTNDDHVTVVLDTFGKHRVGYVFDINAGGNRSDGLISPAAPDTSYDWNGDWTAAVTRNAHGWTSEIAIDTRSLQFPAGVDHWNLNLVRYVPRDQLTLQWAGISRDASGTDLSRAGTLQGVGGFEQSLGWQIAPYALARAGTSHQAGVDLRYNVSPELAGIVTINPDFAEAQVDAQQINLTPYALFLPERRSFFLEGSNQFTFAYGISSIFIPFYSRTIGLLGNQTIALNEGIKVVGQAGPWSIGALDVQMGPSANGAPTNLFASHVTYDVDDHLRVGAMLTHGDPTGATHNTFEGLDAVWHTATFQGDKNLYASGWVARSSGDALPGRPTGWGFYVDYPNDLWRWVISDNTFGDALDPALGFLPRPGTHQYDLYTGYYPRPAGESWVRKFLFEVELLQVDDLHGTTQTRQLMLIPFNINTESGEHLEAHWTPEYEALTTPFAIANGVTLPIGQYHFSLAHLQAESAPSRDWQVGNQVQFGTFYDGRLLQTKPYITWTGVDGRLRIECTNEIDWGSLREGHFVQRLYQLKASYSFNPNLTVSSFTQYDSALGHIGVNAQVRWIIAPQRELFVVLNHNVTASVTDLAAPYQPPAQGNVATVKLQWDFRL